MSYLAGEPVPPGFEHEIGRTAVIQKQIESFNDGPLIGTEYVVELHENGQIRPDYFCVLCNTCNDVRSIFIHWTSVTHRTNYLRTHYQKAFDLLQQMRRSSSNSPEQVLKITTKLVQIIEQQHGRSTQILAIDGDYFRRYRAKICAQVRDKSHYDECSGPDFIKEMRQFISDTKPPMESQSIVLDAISSDDDEVYFTPTTPQQQQQQNVKKSRKKQEEQQPAYRAVTTASTVVPTAGALTTTAGLKALPTPKELSMQASQIAQERYKWEKFRCVLERQLKELRDVNETYETSPEKHPDYSVEWKQFWNRRYKQLQEEKKCDPNSYDYKPEWISYWKDRRVELFNTAVNKIKKELQEKFQLGDEDEDNTKLLMERYKIRVSSPKADNANAATTTGSQAATTLGVRRKPNYRSSSNRAGNGCMSSESIIDISDDEQAPSGPSATRPHRRPPYGRSLSRSESPKRDRRLGRGRSRSRSPMASRRLSRSRSPSPYSRSRNISQSSRGHDDYGRDRERDDYYRNRDRDRSASYSRSRNYDEPMETFRVLDSRLYPEYSGQRKDSPASTTAAVATASSKEVEEEHDGRITVVTVLRMLSALEDHLGSLGPKALNMLSKALAMEKIKPNAADDLLLNEDNCVFMETIKEKLKGILIAQVLDDPQKVRVVKKLISNIATVIFQVTSNDVKETGAQADASSHSGDLAKKSLKDYQLPYDRQLVSSKLANALIVNGVDDMSVDDMNRLLHFFTLLAKTHHTRRQTDRSLNSGLNFSEAVARLGLKTSLDSEAICNQDDINLKVLIQEVENHFAAKDNSNDQLQHQPQQQQQQQQQNCVNESSNGMDLLSDSDLQTLLNNFKFLSNEEQVHLVSHLRKLEVLEPARVERLRKFVNMAELSSDGESCSDYLLRVVTNVRPGAASATTANSLDAMRRKSSDQQLGTTAAAATTAAGKLPMRNFTLDEDDEDDDYEFSDLIKKANETHANGTTTTLLSGNNSNTDNSNNIGSNNNKTSTSGSNQIGGLPSTANALTFKPATSAKISLKDTENIIANLMGTLTNNSSHGANKSQQLSQQSFGGNKRLCFPGGRFYDFASDQQQQQQQSLSPTSNPANSYQNMQQQQQQLPGGYSMNNFNAYGQQQINPWANNGAYNNMPQQQNYMPQQQQQQNYLPQQPPYTNNNNSGNNMFGGHH
ncbi:uncharacterized protein CG7065-like [Drosophila albomicans]|uniref:Uncharacterized protein CG7065-like n=1 Tax=Drosophila albomicans TaxID=7291 RepID=A0A6P8W1N2_DROAB|nr:uncharacterized protein CG7065-like [Drosophila albomicans]XP_034097540.1 uncharacterized protein CG7065-like [Drosophila albomicans]